VAKRPPTAQDRKSGERVEPEAAPIPTQHTAARIATKRRVRIHASPEGKR